jgi:hypothetical protein
VVVRAPRASLPPAFSDGAEVANALNPWLDVQDIVFAFFKG